jgi:NAD(P)-dependent dehydrogenase (short-subunit alcohol dehydrogenase family)
MAKQPRSLSGKVVAITGGARGIGRATAAALIREGARVAIGDVDAATAQQTAEELGAGTVALELNVTDRESFEGFVSQVEERLGPVDVLINNAGIMPVGLFVDEDDATAARQIDINLHGVIYGTKIALRRMLPRRSGHIVNIASVAGKTGVPGVATYAGTKHAVVGITEAVRQEIRGSGVDLSVVMPVLVNTGLGSGLKAGRAVEKIEPEDVAEEIVRALKLNRYDVFVPRNMSVLLGLTGITPRRLREAIARFLKSDQIMANVDAHERAAYEERASRSEPGREPEAPQKDVVAPPDETTDDRRQTTEV